MALLDFIPIVGDVIDAVAGHYESNRQMHYQTDSMREQMAWQEKMNQQQQEWQESMWNKTNEYNTPQNQIARLVQAGVNPNNAAQMIAGGNNQANLAQQPQTPSAPGGLNGSMPAPTHFGDVADGFLLSKQAKLLDAQAEKTEKEAESVDEDVTQKKMQNSVWMANWNVDMAVKAADIQVSKRTAEQLQFQVDVLFPQQEEMNEQEINNLCGAAVKLAQETALLKKEEKLYGEKIKTEQAQQGLLAAETGEANARTAKVRSEAYSIDLQNAIDEKSAAIAKKYGVDPSKLDAIAEINLKLSEEGATEEEIEAFWAATRGDLSSRFQNGLVKILDNPGQAVGNVVRTARSLKGRGQRVNNGTINNGTINSSDVNPQPNPQPKYEAPKYKSKTVYRY